MSVIKVAQYRHGLCPLPAKTDWSGLWIWVPDSSGYGWRNSYAFFRKRFSASGPIRIDIAADTRYEVYLDGERIGRGTAPSAVDYKTFDTYAMDVEPDEHVICVRVHHIGETCATAHKSRPGLLVEIAREHGDAISSDSTWKVLPGTAFEQDIPVMMSHFGFHEVCDFRRMPKGWTDPSLNLMIPAGMTPKCSAAPVANPGSD
ncbi:MAG: hypothetical protein M1305_04575 [Candidatus Marsarchaeota archaeon]|nr:hypothetical protein [Candidatus Marsarchaeota archaeon]